jgi:hypothetical protein
MPRVRCDHDAQRFLLPLWQLWLEQRLLVIRNLEFGICNTMTGTVVHEHKVRSGNRPAGRALPALPSLTSLAFLVPVVLLYWQMGGPSALLTDPNTGVHVRAGKWILSHHAIPRQDLFSFTLAGYAWCDWEWLSDVLYAVLFQVRGLSAIVAFHLALLCLVSVILYRTARLRVGPTMAFAVTGLLMATTTIHWLARPHLFTWLFLGVFCFLLERADVTGEYRPLLALPVLMILWVNLHPGFVVGLMCLLPGMYRPSYGAGWPATATRGVSAGTKRSGFV